MKLKDLIGIIPRSEEIEINGKTPCRFDEVDWSMWDKEVQLIWANNYDWVKGVISIEVCD